MEVMRRAWQAFISGGVEATLEGWTEDCVFEEFPEMPESAVYVGRDRLSEAVEHFTEMWSDLVWEPLEFIDAGENLVIAVVRYRGRGRASGIDLRSNLSAVFDVRGGQITRIEFYFDHAKALEAAGLRE